MQQHPYTHTHTEREREREGGRERFRRSIKILEWNLAVPHALSEGMAVTAVPCAIGSRSALAQLASGLAYNNRPSFSGSGNRTLQLVHDWRGLPWHAHTQSEAEY